MSEQRFLTPLQLAEARRLWAAGESEQAVAAAVGMGISTWRRCRSPGGQLADLPVRAHTSRNSGRRSEELGPRLLWDRCAKVRLGWSEAERAERSNGLLSAGRNTAGQGRPATPFPTGHNLRVLPDPRRH